jgi:hypothetical protein
VASSCPGCGWRASSTPKPSGRCSRRNAAEAHNRLGLTEHLDPGTRPYYSRPYQVLDAVRFAAALTDAITDPVIRQLPSAGVADQVIDSTPALGDLRYLRAVTSVSDRDMPVLGVGDTQT